VWPASAVRGADGELALGGVPVSDLVATYGTPLYVFDRDDMIERARLIRTVIDNACQKHGVTGSVYYASKSFTSGHAVSWLAKEGLGFDVATGGELAIALAAGADPRRIEFQGNNKSEEELRQALLAGVGTIVLDAPIEADRCAAIASELGIVQNVMVRVNTGVHADTHDYLATAREDQKFGLSPSEASELVERIRGIGSLKCIGLHSHIGSQIFAVEGFLEAATRLMAVYASLLETGELGSLNLGGGFGIAYTEADTPMDTTEMVSAIVDHVAKEAADRGVPMPELSFEPGRIISGPAGVTLYSVGVTKPVSVTLEDGDTATRLYVSVDGGMSDNARPALYGAQYSSRLANRVSDAPPALVRVVGKHCESGDIVVDSEYVPGDVHPGDILAVATTGAYCYSLASNYNVVPRPPVVWVSGAQHGVMVSGETIADILARDQGFSSTTGRNSDYA
jgi:diaminopimelate decarboxylase